MDNYLIVPANFDAEKLLNEHKPEGYKHKITPFYLNFIISSICCQLHKEYLRDKQRNLHGLVALKAAYLQNVIHHNYQSCILYLQQQGIIEVSRQYKKNVHSRMYRLEDQYTFSNVKTIQISNKQMSRLKRCFSNKAEKEINEIDNRRQHLFKFFNDGKLSIRYREALIWIELAEHKELMEFDEKRHRQKRDNEKQLSVLRMKWQVQRNLIQLINEGKFFNIHSDIFGYRFHSPLTYMKSELRGFLLYDNNELVSCDIKNSQPFCSLVFLKPAFWGLHNQQRPEGISNVSSLIGLQDSLIPFMMNCYKQLLTSIMMENYSETHACIELQKSNYIQDVTSGRIYEETMAALNITAKFDEEWKRKRKAIKKQVLVFLNEHPSKGEFPDDDNDFIQPSKIRKVFENKYGILVELFDAIKSYMTGNKKFYKVKRTSDLYFSEDFVYDKAIYVDTGFTMLARLLQRIESFLVLDVICKELSQEEPEMPLFTVHDCISTTEPFLHILNDKILSIFKDYIGYVPKVEVEYWKAISPIYIKI